jgi:hypothetical protein
MIKKILFCALIITINIFSQEYFIRGTVYDAKSKTPLPYTSIRVLFTSFGTTSNIDGNFEIKVKKGNYRFAASYLGYFSDTVSVDLSKNISGVSFNLKETNVNLPEIVIHPGENPANIIIKKAIQKKNSRNSFIKDYVYYAYTKGVIKTQSDFDINGAGNTLSVSSSKDTSELKIAGILENESRGYFKQPNLKKDIIIARKQSANFSSQLNTITGGRLTQNFYSENINLFGKELPGPLSDEALSYYYYYIKDRVMINNQPVYKIYMAPDYSSNPGLTGYIYIADSTYNLVKVELGLNRAANTGGFFESFTAEQQFEMQKDSIPMPAYYHINAKLNILNLAKIGFELLTSLNNYEINTGIKDDFFSKAAITVLNDADKKDSSYWSNLQSIPNTDEEKIAYKRIDSVSAIPRTFWDNFSFLSDYESINSNLGFSGPLGIYHFSKVEGHTLDFSIWGRDYFEKRLNSSLYFSYGFADKKFKSDINADYLLGNYREHKISFNAFNRINKLFEASSNYNEIYSTLISLISKYDYNDYFYSKGFGIKYNGEVFPVLSVSAGFNNTTYSNAYTNSNVTWFYKNRSFSKNSLIYESRLNTLSAGFKFDFRDYIEDGYFRHRMSNNDFNIYFDGNVTYSNHNLFKSSLDFTKYETNLYGNIKTSRSTGFGYHFTGIYTNGYLPYQLLYSLPGNVETTSKNYSFRTLRVNEYLGDRVFEAFLEHNFGNSIFRMLHIPYLKDSEIKLSAFFNAAVSSVSDKTKSILTNSCKVFDKPFYEAGFRIGHITFPISVDFGWKLNYRGTNNFSIGINTLLISE